MGELSAVGPHAARRVPGPVRGRRRSLDAQTARATAVVLARAGGRASLDFSQVVVSAQARGWPVITAAPGPLFALAPDVAVEVLP